MDADTRAAGQRLLEEQLLDIYADTNTKWEENQSALFQGQCGFGILGSRPTFAPELLIIGENPGFSEQDIKIAKPHIQRRWPQTPYIDDSTLEKEGSLNSDKERYRGRLRKVFRNAGLDDVLYNAVTTNFLFFKSHCLTGKHPLAWSKVDRTLRRELERFSEERMRRIIGQMKPKMVMVAGMGLLQKHNLPRTSEPTLAHGKNEWLIVDTVVFGVAAFAIRHPSAPTWSKEDDAILTASLRQRFAR